MLILMNGEGKEKRWMQLRKEEKIKEDMQQIKEEEEGKAESEKEE